MNEKYTFRTASEALPFLCSRLLDVGLETGSRNGRVKELLNAQIVLTDPQRREILSTNRKANVFAQIAETMWVLSGRNDIEWLSAYLPRAKEFSDDGETWRGGYGPRLRAWSSRKPGEDYYRPIDQIAHVVDLLKRDPLSRRAVISIYDPGIDTADGKDIPCNDFIQFQSRLGALYMTVTVRSNDLMWGWSGINAFEWSVLQEIVAHLLGVTIGPLTFNIGNLHLYERHWDKARRIEHDLVPYAITPFQMPDYADRTLEWVDVLIDRWFAWEGMCRRDEAAPALLEDFEEPLFRSWAAAIAYYWQREDHWLEMLAGTALGVAVARTPSSLLPEPRQTSRSTGAVPGHPGALHDRTRAFYEFVANLHAVKHASYGDSWKKRGEQMSILANIARKVDRLGVGDKFDSSADTVIDLMVYLIKYGWWLQGVDDGPDSVNTSLDLYLDKTSAVSTDGWALDVTFADIQGDFNTYCDSIEDQRLEDKLRFVSDMLETVTPVARDLWLREQDGVDDYRGADAD